MPTPNYRHAHEWTPRLRDSRHSQAAEYILSSFSGDRLILFTLGRKVLPRTISINFEGLFSNSCDAVPQVSTWMWPGLSLALILEDHTDQGSAVQSLDVVAPDWSMPCIPWLLALNAYHHGSGYDPDILAADCPWTFHKLHSPAAFDTASQLLWYFWLPLKSVSHIFYRGHESDTSVLGPTASLLVAAAPSIYQLDILSLRYARSDVFSVPSLQIHTIAETADHTRP